MIETDRTTLLRLLDERHDKLIAELDELAARVDAALVAFGLNRQADVATAEGGRLDGEIPPAPAQTSTRRPRSKSTVKVA